MPWITVTSAEVLEEFSEREKAALDAIKGAAALDGILSRVVAEVRGAILAGNYALGDEGTIPDALAGHAIALARWRFLTSVAKAEALQTDGRKAASEAAAKILERISNMDYAVESPTSSAQRQGNWNSFNKLQPRAHPIPRPGDQTQGLPGAYANPDAPEDFSASDG